MLKKLFQNKSKKEQTKAMNHICKSGGNDSPLYGLGFIGALVHYWQVAEPYFMSKVFAIVKAMLWPGFLVYDLLRHLAG